MGKHSRIKHPRNINRSCLVRTKSSHKRHHHHNLQFRTRRTSYSTIGNRKRRTRTFPNGAQHHQRKRINTRSRTKRPLCKRTIQISKKRRKPQRCIYRQIIVFRHDRSSKLRTIQSPIPKHKRPKTSIILQRTNDK